MYDKEHILRTGEPMDLTNYAIEVLKKRWPEAEERISKDHKASVYYALGVIKGRWLPGEKAILTDVRSSYLYARNIFGDRWVEAEPIIMTDIKAVLCYSFYVIHRRWLEAEALIYGNKDYLNQYLEHFDITTEEMIDTNPLLKSFESTEDTPLMESTSHLDLSRFTSEEDLLENGSPLEITEYIRTRRKARWPEAESRILDDIDAAKRYAYYTIRGRWPRLEQIFLTMDISRPSINDLFLKTYIIDLIKGRWVDIESNILSSVDLSTWYAKFIMKERWKEAEVSIILRKEDYNSTSFKEYCLYFGLDRDKLKEDLEKKIKLNIDDIQDLPLNESKRKRLNILLNKVTAFNKHGEIF